MDDQQAAIALERAKQQTVYRSNFPQETREKLLKEKIAYYKQQIAAGVTNKEPERLDEFAGKLIKTCAQLFALKIDDGRGKITTDENVIQKELKKYYTDCYNTKLNVRILLQSLTKN